MAAIPNCIKYDPTNAAICLECDHYLHFGKITKRCECENGSGTTCQPDFSCGLDLQRCIPVNQCMSIENCLECRYADHSICHECAKGNFPSPDGKACISLSTCDHVDLCKECSISDPKKCQKCHNFMFVSDDDKSCECAKGSGVACEKGYNCAVNTRECVKRNSCRNLVDNCNLCIYEDERLCFRCNSGYTLVDGKCVILDQCYPASPLCEHCDPNAPETCLKCKNGLSVGPDHVTCECTLGSKQPCHGDQVCTKHYHICVEKQSCLSFPSLIQGCLDCNFGDPRFCYKCQEDLVLSVDRLHCLPKTTCMLLQGCAECNVIQPNLCFKCEEGLNLSSDGMQCYCGNEGQICQDGSQCKKGSCQLVAINKASAGQIAGIVIVVIILIAVIIGLVVFIFIQKKQAVVEKPQEHKSQTSFSKSLLI